MNAKRSVGLGALCLLAACQAQTIPGMRNRAPVLSADTDRTTIEVGSCLVAALEKLGAASYVPSPQGATVSLSLTPSFGSAGTPLFTANIVDEGASRHVTVWTFKTVWAVENRHRIEAVRACVPQRGTSS